MTVVRIGPDVDTRNCLRIFVDGEQWCKVYAFTSQDVHQRASTIKAALEVALKDPAQRELPLGPIALKGALMCPDTPQRLGQDQYRCNVCGVVWDTNELRPPCNSKL